MKIGILLTYVAEYGKSGFYNNQETGLAKELSKLVDGLIIYKAVAATEKPEEIPFSECPHTVLKRVPTKANGMNGVWDCSVMDPSLDAIIYFSDTQLAVPSVYKWCREHQVKLFPYIGVSESHSTSAVKRMVMDFFFSRNVSVYKKCVCFVKTPDVEAALAKKGIQNTVVTPVGIDVSLLHEEYKKADLDALKVKWGFAPEDKILLFIGRMTEEKQPQLMIKIFQRVYREQPRYKLLMVGKGELLDAVRQAAQGLPVKFVEQVPNADIWELYRIAEAFVNLNRQEIFGMAILEAMYYECKVIAWKAPGPNFIIGGEPYGCLRDSDEGMIAAIEKNDIDTQAAHQRILDSFTWASTAKLMREQIG